jgi:DNA-binding transcriptional ArsR family regulator
MANSATATLDRTFEACAHPIRRAILERLAAAELTVGEASAGLGVSKPTISRHLRVLEQAGAVVRIVDGRTHRLQIAQGPLLAASLWIDRQRELWERKFDAVERFLAEEEVAGAPPRGAPDAETGP